MDGAAWCLQGAAEVRDRWVHEQVPGTWRTAPKSLQSGTLPVVPPVKSSSASPETVLSGPGAASKVFKAVPGVVEKPPGGFQSRMCVSVCFSQSEASISPGPVLGPNMAAAASSVPKHSHNPTRGGGGRSGSGFSSGLIMEGAGGVGMGILAHVQVGGGSGSVH